MEPEQKYDMSQLSDEDLEEMEDMVDDAKQDEVEEQLEMSAEAAEAYGAPEPEQKQNAHSFLHKASFDAKDTVRTTFLSEQELGRPLFSVRFLLDLHDVARYYFNGILKDLGYKDPDSYNGMAIYFDEKVRNITHSGMSNKGFAMNLVVTTKKDVSKKRIRPNIENLKGGKS